MICILGRTGVGKSTLVKYLTQYTPVVSYCDRPKRNDETEGVEHHFVSKAEFDRLYASEPHAAYTVIKGTRYMALVSQLKPNSVYVIDPAGLATLGDIPTFNVYLWADDDTRRQRAEGRNYNYDERNADEDSMFTDFESMGRIDLWLDTTNNTPKQLAEEILHAIQ